MFSHDLCGLSKGSEGRWIPYSKRLLIVFARQVHFSSKSIFGCFQPNIHRQVRGNCRSLFLPRTWRSGAKFKQVSSVEGRFVWARERERPLMWGCVMSYFLSVTTAMCSTAVPGYSGLRQNCLSVGYVSGCTDPAHRSQTHRTVSLLTEPAQRHDIPTPARMAQMPIVHVDASNAKV